MRCPYCQREGTRVVDSREIEGGVRRRRQCQGCGARFTTLERVPTARLLVVKKDKRREEWNREKLAAGIRKACAKRPISYETIDKMVNEIEDQVHRLGRPEVSSSVIGEMVMDKLRKLDHIAYIRFASVYREFADLGSLKKEVDSLLQAIPVPSPQLPLLPQALTAPSGGGRKRQRRKTLPLASQSKR